MKKSFLFVLVIIVLALCLTAALSGCNEYEPNEATVKYSEFGAVGDGKTDDFAAIVATHEYANKNKIAVCADRGATYYIGGKGETAEVHRKGAVIKTNTYWLDAKFIIDDQDITDKKVKSAEIFSVESDVKKENITLPDGYSLSAGQKKIGLSFDSAKLLHIVNSEKKDFIRSGVDQNNGSDRQEVILVNSKGKVDKTTPIIWDYTKVTSMTAYSVDDEKITVSGGNFVTVASNAYDGYYNRGIVVRRSNTVVKGVKHTVTDEVTSGSPYAGFLVAEKASNIKFEKCKLWGHLTPIRSNGLTQGTYDISAKLANKVTWKKCEQINDLQYGWGIMGSNHCKNLTMTGCYLSRFDAHQGVYNATVKNTTLRDFSVVGFGKLYVENVCKMSVKDEDYGETAFLTLRSDYGAFWHGDAIFKNCTMESNATVNYIIKEVWRDWDYGYTCYLPTNITVDNVTVNYVGQNKKPSFWVLSNIDTSKTHTIETMAMTANPLVMPEKVSVKNCTTDFQLTTNKTGLLDGTVFEKA